MGYTAYRTSSPVATLFEILLYSSYVAHDESSYLSETPFVFYISPHIGTVPPTLLGLIALLVLLWRNRLHYVASTYNGCYVKV
jgi:hypothetical protein